eukprot:TRINITY_DN8157_c0_g1_i25.p1 TRINITY_DN8157_c0_g1~~TRINITY_DN8157_c0_g1_i25.p1  ORF type:complete len:126 (+),score=1.93 TRINITY_DN8157_c0_g1_i25:301-678(+)
MFGCFMRAIIFTSFMYDSSCAALISSFESNYRLKANHLHCKLLVCSTLDDFQDNTKRTSSQYCVHYVDVSEELCADEIKGEILKLIPVKTLPQLVLQIPLILRKLFVRWTPQCLVCTIIFHCNMG